MPPTNSSELGQLTPVGGGDPIPLKKTELVVGRRPSCDICLDFSNVSGKHCKLRMLNNIWSVRDLGSSNGTTLNGSKIVSEHNLMPDDELGIAGHLFKIDYVPGGPESFMDDHKALDGNHYEKKRTSLMEMAGLDTDGKKLQPRAPRATRAPELIERLSVDEAEFDDTLPEHFKAPTKPAVKKSNDDDFFKLIEEDVKDSNT